MEIEEILNPRITEHCLPLWNDGDYKHAAHEALVQVEKALKEKAPVSEMSKVYGHTLISLLLGTDGREKYVRLRIPLSDDLQQQGEKFFQGVFGYYRNYTAHNDSKISKTISARVMIIACELLDLIDESLLSYADIGGVEGLIKLGEFSSKQQIYDVLVNLEHRYLPDGDIDSLLKDFFERYDIGERQLGILIDLELIRFVEEEYIPSVNEWQIMWQNYSPPKIIGHFDITDLGQKFLDEMSQNKE